MPHPSIGDNYTVMVMGYKKLCNHKNRPLIIDGCHACHIENLRDERASKNRQIKAVERKNRELERQVLELANMIYNAAIGDVCMGYSTDIVGMARQADDITGINADAAKLRLDDIKRAEASGK